MFSDPSLWVALGFFIFIAILIYKKLPALLIHSLDERALRIKEELDEAEQLRSEAQFLLVSYQKKQRAASAEMDAIIEKAKKMAHEQASSMTESVEKMLDRRKASAQARIEQLKHDLLNDLRQRSADVVIIAAHLIIEQNKASVEHSKIIEDSINTVSEKI